MLDCLTPRLLARPLWMGGLLALAVSAGCGGPQGPMRVPLQGKVEQGGKPVPVGLISFLPAAGNAGPAANASIKGGEYRFTKEDGPITGAHVVEISTAIPSKETPPPSAVPKKTKWEFKDVTVSETGPLEKDFRLE